MFMLYFESNRGRQMQRTLCADAHCGACSAQECYTIAFTHSPLQLRFADVYTDVINYLLLRLRHTGVIA